MGRTCLAKIAGWRVSGKVPWSCVKKDWRGAYWNGAEGKLSGRDVQTDLRVDDVLNWRQKCNDFLR